MRLRCEIFPSDMDATRNFYEKVLRFKIARYQKEYPGPYLALERGSVRIGAALRPDGDVEKRTPPTGVEIVLEVDDIAEECQHVEMSGWPIAEPLRKRPWGLTDFRVVDPSGYYIRVTDVTP